MLTTWSSVWRILPHRDRRPGPFCSRGSSVSRQGCHR